MIYNIGLITYCFEIRYIKLARFAHHPGFEGLPLLTLGLVVVLVAVVHPLHVALDHGVLPARTPAVVITQHLPQSAPVRTS